MFPYHIMPNTRPHKKTYEERAEQANYYADKRIAYKIARGEATGNTEYWKRRFPEVFTNVALERANKTIDKMVEQTKEVREKLRN